MFISYSKKGEYLSGFTIIEMMIAIAILGSLLAIAFQVIGTSQRTYSTNAVQSDLEDRGRRFVDKLQDALTYAKVISITNSHTVLTFRQPIDANGDGTIFDGMGNIEWGVNSGGVPQLNWNYEYTFSPTQTVSEAGTGIDYNGDGALNAMFAIGKITYSVKDTLGAVREYAAITDDVIVRVNAIPNPTLLDLQMSNGAGVGGNFFNLGGGGATGDPIFIQLDNTGVEVPTNPSAVFINVWHGKFDAGDPTRFYTKRNYTVVGLRNPQT